MISFDSKPEMIKIRVCTTHRKYIQGGIPSQSKFICHVYNDYNLYQ